MLIGALPHLEWQQARHHLLSCKISGMNKARNTTNAYVCWCILLPVCAPVVFPGGSAVVSSQDIPEQQISVSSVQGYQEEHLIKYQAPVDVRLVFSCDAATGRVQHDKHFNECEEAAPSCTWSCSLQAGLMPWHMPSSLDMCCFGIAFTKRAC